jgi:hypothetical protein
MVKKLYKEMQTDIEKYGYTKETLELYYQKVAIIAVLWEKFVKAL